MEIDPHTKGLPRNRPRRHASNSSCTGWTFTPAWRPAWTSRARSANPSARGESLPARAAPPLPASDTAHMRPTRSRTRGPALGEADGL